MRRSMSMAVAGFATLALMAAPAIADPPPDVPGAKKRQQTQPPPPSASPQEKAKAYGRLCQGQSKKHVAGQKGTPFSQCVTAMAKAAHDNKTEDPKKAARKACKGLSKKHVKGQKGTPYSQCIRAAAKLDKDQAS